jgi:hypothetical protein
MVSYFLIGGHNIDIKIYHQNAFSECLAKFGFNMFSMVVVDLLHKIDLGVWKAIFIHLLCILDCQHESLKHELDRWWVTLGCPKIYIHIIPGFKNSLPSALTL